MKIKKGEIYEKEAILFKKIHRYLTIPFIILTLLVMVFTQGMPINALLFRLQRIFMLILAFTGVYMFLYPYLNKVLKKSKPVKKEM
ncbi:MAG: hypothetical protein MUO55_01625 [Candidatus Atribacteria bacterium]|nr:hypothetical protein [Candidatus Atribacteria bacterium]